MLLQRVRTSLQAAGIDAADVEARWIVEAVTGRRPDLAQDSEVDPAAVEAALAMAARRARREPLQYVTGTAGFRRLILGVGPGVFIPRPETELVAERAMEVLPRNGVVVDVGTGSGAIALAVADERPDARVFATECSTEARRWAEKNVAACELDVALFDGDLLAGLPEELRGSVDVVVSNPPYVAEGDDLPPEVSDHEPRVALYSGRRGTEVIERLAEQARTWLRPGGWLVLEIGETLGGAVTKLLVRWGYSEVSIAADLAGRDRIASGRWSGS